MNIAIDGPAGAGKSSVARGVAKRLGYIYVDTGALYRAIALYMRRNGIPTGDSGAVCGALAKVSAELRFLDGEQRVILCGEDVTGELRGEQMSMAASSVSAIQQVRDFLIELQRDIAKKNNVVMDGRDIGTVILPNAEVKIFLTAAPEARAQRRVLQLAEKGIAADYNEVVADVIKRDYNDSNREAAPLRQAQDAVLLDSTSMNETEVVEKILEIINERRKT